MKCFECKAWTFVLETRLRKDGMTIRRRECANGHRMSTIETPYRVDKKKLSSGKHRSEN